MSTECKEFSTPRDVYSSILQAHWGFIIVSLLQVILSRELMSTCVSQTMNQINVSSNKIIGTISSTTDHFIISIFNNNRAIKRYVRSHIVHSVPHSSALKNILLFDYRNYLKTRISRCKPVGTPRAKGSRLYFTIGYVYTSFQNKKCET